MENTKNKLNTKKPQFVILTVVSMNTNSFGLQDHNFHFEVSDLSITFLDEKINLENSLLAYNRNGRLTNPYINDWIQKNKLQHTNEPIKLIFNLKRTGSKYHYVLYKTQGNYLTNHFNLTLSK
jgi:hypothetical protein